MSRPEANARHGADARKETDVTAPYSDEFEDVLDVDAMMEGEWSSAVRPRRTNAMEPWPAPLTCVGASILAFCIDPQHDRAYFWLGKERKVLAWGAGSHRWSDFGGGRARGDADPAATAAREFTQETAGCMRFFETDGTNVRTRYEDIAAALRAGEHVMKLETAVGRGPSCPESCTVREATTNEAEGTRVYVTYVVQVPWDPRTIMRFQHCRALLSGIHKQLLRVPLDAAEQDALCPADDVLRASRERWVLYHPAVRYRMRMVPSALVYKSLSASSSPLVVNVVRHSGDTDDANTPPTCVTEDVERTPLADDVERTPLADDMERMPVIDSVNMDYLEKDSLELWSVPQLRRALQYDGILSNRDGSVESLRPSFMTILTAILTELRERFPMHFDEAPGFAFPTVTF